MAFSHRQFYQNQSGRVAHNLNFNGPPVTRRTVVLVTAAPCDVDSGGPVFDPNIRLNVHGPDVRVSNIVPHGPEGGPTTGGVEFVLTVDSPTDIAVTITLLDPWENFGIQ